jgi:RING finger/CCCH-type zinc finger protein
VRHSNFDHVRFSFNSSSCAQAPVSFEIDVLPINGAILKLLSSGNLKKSSINAPSELPPGRFEITVPEISEEEKGVLVESLKCVEGLAAYLMRGAAAAGKGLGPALSRPMQRKLITLLNCQLVEGEGRARAVRACRSLGERTVNELILLHQNPQQLSANLWAAVRSRGCQFLGPGEQKCHSLLRIVIF